MEKINIKRIYDELSDDNGYRILVDRLWPRGISKKEANLDEWNKEIAPTTELRKWFNHEKEKFEEFALRYRDELKEKEDTLNELRKIGNYKTLYLLYAAKDKDINHVVVLKEVLEEKN